MKKCEDLDFVNRFCDCLRLGMSIKSAAKGFNISDVQLYSYIHTAEEQLKENPDATSPEINFLNSIKNAEREFEDINLTIIKNAAHKGDWKASAWLLERRRPDQYALKQDVSVGAKTNSENNTKIQVEYIDPKKDDDRVKQIEKQL